MGKYISTTARDMYGSHHAELQMLIERTLTWNFEMLNPSRVTSWVVRAFRIKRCVV